MPACRQSCAKQLRSRQLPACPTLQASPDLAPEVQAACSDPARVVSHPVLFLMRSDAGSMYHHWEDVPALLTSLWLLPGVQQAVQERGLQVGWLAGCCRPGCADLAAADLAVQTWLCRPGCADLAVRPLCLWVMSRRLLQGQGRARCRAAHPADQVEEKRG